MIPELTQCPDAECGVLAEIVDRYVLESTSGPVEHISTHCAAGHHYAFIGDRR